MLLGHRERAVAEGFRYRVRRRSTFERERRMEATQAVGHDLGNAGQTAQRPHPHVVVGVPSALVRRRIEQQLVGTLFSHESQDQRTELLGNPKPPSGTDATPKDDAIAALGGNPAKATTIPAADSALVSRAARYGVDGGIRGTLAEEDLEFRRKNDGRLLERLFSVNVYYKAYRKMALDQHRELLRWRKLGIATPSAPPAKKGEK